VSSSPYPTILLDFCEKGKWEKATKLCRFVKEPLLWACLAAASLKYKKLESAETAFAAIEIPEKVVFLSELRDSPSEIVRNATLALLFHKSAEAEQIYTQNKFYYRAIRMHIDGYRWERALKLARDYKTHLDTVVAFRKKYLERIGKEEDSKELARAAQEVGEVDWTAIDAKIAEELEKEKKK
jgi:intraflagellar transport protein 80